MLTDSERSGVLPESSLAFPRASIEDAALAHTSTYSYLGFGWTPAHRGEA